MTQRTRIEWTLRLAVAGEFAGHGAFALQGKPQWIGWIQQVLPVDPQTAGQLLFAIGLLDLVVALLVLVRPLRPVLVWAAFWGFATALIRPIVGESFWDFIERWANWGAPLALYLFMNDPRPSRDR